MLSQIQDFIASKDFFSYHGLFLAGVWFIGCLIAILARRISTALHGLLFFFCDAITLFFLAGAWIRVFPYIRYFGEWSLIKQAHIVAGSIFGLFLLVQHVGGVNTFLKGIKKNPEHRKFGFVVSNFARIVCVFGFLLVQENQIALYLGVATVILLFISGYLTFTKKEEKSVVKESVRPKRV